MLLQKKKAHLYQISFSMHQDDKISCHIGEGLPLKRERVASRFLYLNQLFKDGLINLKYEIFSDLKENTTEELNFDNDELFEIDIMLNHTEDRILDK